jgi:hypothetical protein
MSSDEDIDEEEELEFKDKLADDELCVLNYVQSRDMAKY